MNDPIDVLLESLHADPVDETTWLALADRLEETGQTDRAELVRLTRCLRTLADGETERRVQELLAAGVQPCVPLRTNAIGMVLVLIPAGKFVMGSPPDEADRSDEEGPQHEVEITRPFYLGVYPVTQEQYERVMGVNPSHFQSVAGENTRLFPVESVSWYDAMKFCRKLSSLSEEKKQGRVYRLPTEAEWEYACRGGVASYQVFHFGNSLTSRQANFDGNYPYGGVGKGPCLQRTCQVGSYKANGFGLYDMHGNVWEWCADWYQADYYRNSPPHDPVGPAPGSDRVFRGGCWNRYGQRCRSAYRSGNDPTYRGSLVGFRVALFPAVQSGEA